MHGNTGARNGQWKGDKVKYNSLHDYIKYHLPKTRLCQCCGTVPPMDCANISGAYKRDLKDWEWLCRRCHMIKDGRMERVSRIRIDRNLLKSVCPICKTEFNKTLAHRKNIFCSRGCSNKSRKKYPNVPAL